MVVRWIHRGCRKNHLWPWMEPQLFYPLHLCVIFVCGWKHEGWSLVLVVKLVKMLYEIISEAQIVRMKSRTRSWTRFGERPSSDIAPGSQLKLTEHPKNAFRIQNCKCIDRRPRRPSHSVRHLPLSFHHSLFSSFHIRAVGIRWNCHWISRAL